MNPYGVSHKASAEKEVAALRDREARMCDAYLLALKSGALPSEAGKRVGAAFGMDAAEVILAFGRSRSVKATNG